MVVPINIELCRLARIPVEEKVAICSHCNEVEDEPHVLVHYPLYDDIRNQLMFAVNNINPNFQNFLMQEKIFQLMSNPIHYQVVSKAICYIINKCRFVIYR